jgi:hypothetical protein
VAVLHDSSLDEILLDEVLAHVALLPIDSAEKCSMTSFKGSSGAWRLKSRRWRAGLTREPSTDL